MRKIYTVGETTYDIIFRNGQPKGAIVGGSVLNMSVTLGRLDLPVSFISRMGNDQIGELSLRFLKENGVNCDYTTQYVGNSRLALAFLDKLNNAEYQFYRAEQAPSLKFPELKSEDIVVFGSTNALRDEGRNSLLLFLNEAHDLNALTVYDPNIREFGAIELIEVRRKFEENLYMTKVLKGSNQDFLRLYNTVNINEIYEKVSVFGVELVIITYGSKSVKIKSTHLEMSFPVEPVKPISTIGAGDNFTSGIVFGFMEHEIQTKDISTLDEDKLLSIVNYANSFASEVCRSESNYISTEFSQQFKLMQNS